MICVADESESVTGLVSWGLPSKVVCCCQSYLPNACSSVVPDNTVGDSVGWERVLICCFCVPPPLSACLWALILLDSGLFGLFGGEE